MLKLLYQYKTKFKAKYFIFYQITNKLVVNWAFANHACESLIKPKKCIHNSWCESNLFYVYINERWH